MLNVLQGITESIKTSLSIADAFKNQELKEAILDIKDKVLNMREENQALREENSKLKEQLKKQAEMKYDGNVYWRKEEGKEQEKFPYCPKCYIGSEKL